MTPLSENWNHVSVETMIWNFCSCVVSGGLSGMARVRLADLNGPKWPSSGQNGPKWTILVHFGLANAKIWFGIRSF